MSLEDLRGQIDAVDAELLGLFERRMELSRQIAEVKRAQGLPIADPAREAEKLREVSGRVAPALAGYACTLYAALFELSKSYQRGAGNIVLVGMPGCGKTTIGRLLAEKLGHPFADADAAIKGEAGMSIPEIFAREGEDGFRIRESAVLERLGRQPGLVISTGGGCVTREENYFHLRQNGVIIFLQRGLDRLARKGRPLSAGDLEAMYARRLPLYRRFADIQADNNAPPERVADRILQTLEVRE